MFKRDPLNVDWSVTLLVNIHSQDVVTYLLTPWYRILFEKLIVSQLVKKIPFLMESEGSSLCSQKPATGPYPVQVRCALKHFVTIKNFYGEGLSAPRPTPPSWRTTPCRLSATAYSIYSQLPSVPGGLPSIRNLRMRHAVVTRDPPNMTQDVTLLMYFCEANECKVVPVFN
jgi:hypothetical protein